MWYEKDRYKDGINMAQFEAIKPISSYNHNYRIGLDKDLLFADSDDDNTTEWWIMCGTKSILLGYSLTSENDVLIRSDMVWT